MIYSGIWVKNALLVVVRLLTGGNALPSATAPAFLSTAGQPSVKMRLKTGKMHPVSFLAILEISVQPFLLRS